MSHLTRVLRFLRHWHARIGVLAALFFLFLALTGLALNHTQALSLAKYQVSMPWLMNWYGLKSQIPETGYLFPQGYLAARHGQVVMDGKPLAIRDKVVGAAEVASVRYVATSQQLFLYQPDGQLVDKLQGDALPVKDITGLAVAANTIIVQGHQQSYASEDALVWKASAVTSESISLKPLPVEVKNQLQQQFAPALPLERILQDIHSGRIFGQYGPYLMDLTAVILMALSLSGVWIYLRTVRRRNY